MPKTLASEIKSIENRYNFRTAKSLGQNFLVDQNAIEEIADGSLASKKDLVIEIGPGVGVLTKALLERAGKVIAIEIDKRLIPILEAETAGFDNISLINDDVLKVDFDSLLSENKTLPSGEPFENLRVVGNLPYYITTPILLGLLEKKVPAKTITVMVQKEVAERIVAEPGGKEFGVLSASLQYYCDAEYILDVPRTSFRPAPNVDSAVVRLSQKENPIRAKSDAVFFESLKKAFSQRRKTLSNSLAGYKGLEKKEIEELLNKINIEPKRRPETLSIEEFVKLADAFTE